MRRGPRFSKSLFADRRLRILFLAEMAISPVVAAAALLVPVLTHWGIFRYAPSVVWLALLIQCLFTFRWRGLWFVPGLPLAFAAITAYLVLAPPRPKAAAPVARVGAMSMPASKPDGSAADPPLIVRNPDGSMTVQKKPAPGGDERRKGLVIPPQVIVPIAPAPARGGQQD